MIASISRVKLFKACRKAYEFRYLEHLEPVEKAEALQTGTNYHELIESLYSEGTLPPADGDWSKELAMAKAYERYIYPAFAVKAVEEWKTKQVGTHTLLGRVDGIAEDGILVEHKTASGDITDEYEFNLQWDEQILAYMYLTGARSVYYTVCRKPTIRKRRGESDAEFFERMVEWYDTDTESKIRLMLIDRTDDEVMNFAREFCVMCDEMEKGVIYRNPSYCTRWGRRCEYASICLNYDPKQTYVEFIRK